MNKGFATVYDRDGRLYVHSSSQTTAGLWIRNDAPVLVPSKENVGEIGRSVRQCLEASRQGVPHPTVWTNMFKPVLKAAKVRSYRAFMTSARCLGVSVAEGVVTLTPTRNEGSRGGFAYLPDAAKITLGSDETLGAAVLEALEKST